jgi:putative phosphoesterase
MIIAVISDIHGNLPALEAVLTDVHSSGAEEIWCLGDFVGYVPFPNEVIKLIRKEKAVSIIGNYDKKVLEFHKKKSKWRKTKKPSKFGAFEWNSRRLTKKTRKFLKDLPKEVRLNLVGLKVLLTHGSPRSIEEPVGPDTPDEVLAELKRRAKADILVTGHSHCFLNKKSNGCWFINPGAVGMPPKTDLKASYILLKVTGRKITLRHRKVKFDIERVGRAMHAAGFAKDLNKFLAEQ